jgi:predicted transcriptional regulator
MQAVLNGIPIEQKERVEGVLEAMSNKYSREILTITRDSQKPAYKIAEETGIPISTVYRRVQKLRDLGLLRTSGEITLEGKRHALYQSKVKAISSTMAGEFINVEITPNPPIMLP